MNSEIIKYVAGGGKTTRAIDILSKNSRGLYLAYTNSVVSEVNEKGYISKTIDSLFSSFIIPKLILLFPLCYGKEIKYFDPDESDFGLKGVGAIHIDENGNIYAKKSGNIYLTDFNINMNRVDFNNFKSKPYYSIISKIFNKSTTLISNTMRNELSNYIIKKYPTLIIDILSARFNFIIIDEAQDLSGYKEEFARLLYNSEIKTYFLGDENQNIINNGVWFEKIAATEINNHSHRCPDTNCKWIRNNLNIKIYGNDNLSEIVNIDYDDVYKFNNKDYYLLYTAKRGKDKEIVESWVGEKSTIKSAKGSTINKSIVIIGKTLNPKCFYTAITRTRSNVYYTIKKI